ncbi:hypothetical protein FGO68_gene759 [Halteria grandinella]|uniref:Uncharacterized protein n=1 Tax=Halteria grandinella TaxID=5974 RepID=A0A8J8NW68_HALGN|nr:hypothetical protein FGO68_gene759 [Halteria grandinella]
MTYFDALNGGVEESAAENVEMVQPLVNAEQNVQEEDLRGDAPVDELLINEELKHEERKMSEMTNSSGNGRYKHQRSLETMSSSEEEEQEQEDDNKQSPEQGRSSGFRQEGDAKRRKISNHSKGIHRQPPKTTRIRKKKDDRESPPQRHPMLEVHN